MSYRVTGVLNPDATGNYLPYVMYEGKMSYYRTDGAFLIWWDGVSSWVISPHPDAPLGPVWIRIHFNIAGEYVPILGALGTATVTIQVPVGAPNIGAWQCVDIGMWQSGCYSVVPSCGKLESVPTLTGQIKARASLEGDLQSTTVVTGQLGDKIKLDGLLESQAKIEGKLGTPIYED